MAMIPSRLPFGISDDSAEKQTKRAKSLHKESWVAAGYFSGIVIKVPLNNLKKYVQEDIVASAKKHNLPVYILKEGSKRASLVEVSL